MFSSLRTVIQNNPKMGYIILDVPMFALTFAFIVMTGNMLSAEELSLFNAALGIFTILSTSGLALQTVIARRIARANSLIGLRSFLWAAFVLLGVAISPVLIPEGMQPKSLTSVGVLAFVFIPISHTFISFFRGILQGLEKFYSLWMAQAIEHAVRIIVLALYLKETISVETAWMVTIIASFSHLLLAAFLVPRKTWSLSFTDPPRQKGLYREIISVIIVNLFLNYLLSFDMIVVGENLGDAGGAYATANKFGRILYFLGTSIAVVLLPLLSRARNTPTIRKYILLGCFGLIPVAGLLSPLGAVILAPILDLMFPPEVIPSFELLSWTIFSNFALSCLHLFITWHIAQQTKFLNFVLGSSCLILTLLFWEQIDSTLYIIKATSLAVWIATIFLSILSYFSPQTDTDS